MVPEFMETLFILICGVLVANVGLAVVLFRHVACLLVVLVLLL